MRKKQMMIDIDLLRERDDDRLYEEMWRDQELPNDTEALEKYFDSLTKNTILFPENQNE